MPSPSDDTVPEPDEPSAVDSSRQLVGAVLFIITYQQEHFIAECLHSALAQDYANLRIVVSDDASTDRTSEVVQDILSAYRGPHKTLFIQQPHNLRIHHINALMPELLSEPFTVMGHGDDVFHPDRVSKSIRTMLREKTYSATANAIDIDAQGEGDKLHIDPELDYDLSMESMCRTVTNRACFGAGLAWRRGVFSQFGRLKQGPRQVDQLIVFRSILLGGASLIREPLMRYRIHDANLNMTRMAELASDADKRLIEERRRNNNVATIIAERELLKIAREKGIGNWDYDKLDNILMETLYEKARLWSVYRSKMVDEGIGIY
jgi:glycosyltransferase involved in cell wall biosynthesis